MPKPKKLTRADLLAYRARWQRINEFQVQQARKMSVAQKVKQANMLFRLATSLNLNHPIDDPEIVAVRERWLKLKQRYENAKRA